MIKQIVASLTFLAASLAHADAGQDCQQTQDPARQVRGCTEYLQQGRGSAKQTSVAYVLRASANLRRGDIGQAEADYSRSIEVDPNWRAYSGRAELSELRAGFWGDQAGLDKAAADFEEAIRLLAASPEPQLPSEFERSLRNHRDCAQDRSPVLRVDACGNLIQEANGGPQAAPAYRNRGRAYIEIHDLRRARSDLDQAIALNPKTIAPYVDRSDLNRSQKQYASAAEDLQHAADLVDALAKEQPDPELSKYAQSLRDAIKGIGTREAMDRLEPRWVAYLKRIQEAGDHSNWSDRPYDAYQSRHVDSDGGVVP